MACLLHNHASIDGVCPHCTALAAKDARISALEAALAKAEKALDQIAEYYHSPANEAAIRAALAAIKEAENG